MKRLSDHPPFTFTLVAFAAVAGALAIGLLGGSGPDRARAADLQPFDSCEELTDFLREHRWAEQSYYGGYPTLREDIAVDAAPAAAELSSGDSAAGAVGNNEAGTNVQEAGIDEPDIAKLDGETLLTIDRGALTATDVSGEDPEPLGSVDLGKTGYGETLLVADGRALVISEDYTDEGAWTMLELVDVSDPSSLEIVKRIELGGSGAEARLIGDTVRLTMNSELGYRGYGEDDSPDASDIEDRLPEIEVNGESAPLIGCDDVARPSTFSGLNLMSVVTLDLADDAEVTDAQALVTNGGTVYASPTSLYVATAAMEEPEDSGRTAAPILDGDVIMPTTFSDETAIHRFDTTQPGATTYASSGTVDGRVLSSWSLSEHEGFLRVATTSGDPWAEGPTESESSVAVFTQDDGQLLQVGSVSGLGRGEQIQGVRFVGDTGYVVTFEQTDPLYTIDLSSPDDPQLAGELKIPGYSAYLHPVGDGRLLGIGQSGTSDGLLTGAQASLFDVATAGDPVQLDTLNLDPGGYGTASAEWDHHAFLYSPENALAVVPVQSYGPNEFSGVVAMRVDEGGGLTELARIEAASGRIDRSFVVDGRLLTLARGEVESRALTDLDG